MDYLVLFVPDFSFIYNLVYKPLFPIIWYQVWLWTIAGVSVAYKRKPRQQFVFRYSSQFHSAPLGQCVQAVYSVLQASQWDLTCCHPFLFCFQHNPKFWQSHYSACHLLSRCFLSWLILRTWRGRRHVSPKRWLTFNRIHSVISRHIELLITTSVTSPLC
jgi:hypothetical protein